jgi:hypothetical protein
MSLHQFLFDNSTKPKDGTYLLEWGLGWPSKSGLHFFSHHNLIDKTIVKCACGVQSTNLTYFYNRQTKAIAYACEECASQWSSKGTFRCTTCPSRHSSKRHDVCQRCGGKTMTYGKHNSKTYRWILENDPSYCKWMQTQKDDTEFSKWLADTPHIYGDSRKRSREDSEINDGTVLDFGKHKGKTFGFVKSASPAYCKWILEQAPVELNTNFIEFRTWIQS